MKIKLLKRADDLTSTKSFEEAFASLVFAVQNDSLPKLADHILGFQLLEKSEDERRAVGILGMQLGNVLVYAPFFFRDGEMSGNELMWLVKSDTFVPKTEKWVDYLINRGTSVLGDMISKDETRRAAGIPDLSAFRALPTKMAASLQKWAQVGLPGLFAATTNIRNSLHVPIDLRELVKDAALAGSLLRIIDQHPRIALYVKQFYGADLIKQALSTVKQATTPLCRAMAAAKKKKKLKKRADVRIYTTLDEDDGSLTPRDKLELMKRGYVVKDYRKRFSKAAEEKQIAVEIERRLVTPTKPGIYSLLMADGSFQDAVVVGKYALFPADGIKHRATANGDNVIVGEVVDDSMDAAYSRAFTLNELAQQIKEYYAQRKKNENYKPETTAVNIVMCDPYGKYVEVVARMATDDPPSKWHFLRNVDCCPTDAKASKYRDNNVNQTIVLGDDKGCDYITITPQVIILPPNVRGFITDVRFYKDPPTPLAASVDAATNRDYARLRQIRDRMKKEGYTLWHMELLCNDTDACINGEWMPKKAGLFKLITDHGFHHDDAVKLLKQSYLQRKKYVVKYAQVEGTAPPMPFPPEPVPTNNPLFGTPALTPQGQMVRPGTQHLSAPHVPADVPLNPPVDPKLVAAVTQAAQTGQKEIFDTSILSSMLTDTDMYRLLDRHLPRLLSGVDAIGRLLFNMYWHYDRFEQRLGKYDVLKLRDTLQTLFKQLGDTVLTLKERGMHGRSVDVAVEEELAKGV